MNTDLNPILFLIDQAFDHKAWHGPNLRGSIRGLTAAEAGWRPSKGRHNIWEIVLHTAYWKYAVRRRLTGEKRGSFPLKGNNWFPRSDKGSEAIWKADIALLEEEHRSLRRTIEGVSPEALTAPALGGKTTVITLVTGIASHDIYHAGQIQLLKRLQKGGR